MSGGGRANRSARPPASEEGLSDATQPAPAGDAPGAHEVDLERVGRRVEHLIDEVAAAEPVAAHAAEQLVSELLGLYGAGLARILALLDDAAPGVSAQLADDPLLAGLLSLHDLHPVDVRTRIERALDGVRPYLGSHGGDVELVGVEGEVAHLRLKGSCDGCAASASTLEMAVDGAIREAAPEIDRLEVQGAVDPADANEGLIPLSALTIRRDADTDHGDGADGVWRWLDVSTTPSERLAATDVDGQRILLGRVGPDLYAYRDACPACRSSLDGAAVSDGAVGCPGCQRRYDVRIAGRPVDAEGVGLQPVPLVEGADGARVALGGGR